MVEIFANVVPYFAAFLTLTVASHGFPIAFRWLLDGLDIPKVDHNTHYSCYFFEARGTWHEAIDERFM